MIPKIIHYTWFSHDEMPEKIKRCMASWKRVLPDYEIKHWGMEEIQNIDSDFLREALDAHMWAYAADFVRLWAVYHEGGIYLDTDVEVYKSFDNLLNEKGFIGRESSIHEFNEGVIQTLSSHCFGAEKENLFIKRCLDYFKDRHFITSKNNDLPKPLRQNIVLLPYIQAQIAIQMGYNCSPREKGVQLLTDGTKVFPAEIFDPFQGHSYDRSKSYCLHLANGSWRDPASGSQVKIGVFEKILIRLLRPLLAKMHYSIFKY